MAGPRYTLLVGLLYWVARVGALGAPASPPRPTGPDASGSATLKALLKSGEVRGGLCVHVECGDGRLTCELALGGKFLVHGLTADGASVARAREGTTTGRMARTVSFDGWDRRCLPYPDSTVDALILDGKPSPLQAGLSWSEAARVVSPFGAILVRTAGTVSKLPSPGEGLALLDAGNAARAGARGEWTLFRKAYPADTDEWTHSEHDAGRSSVSRDRRAGPPAGLQWSAGSQWPTYRVFSDPPEGFATALGRCFYWATDNRRAVQRPPGSRLVARNAYNGRLLWERSLQGRARPSCLVADGERVFAHLGAGQMLALDAATGRLLKSYERAVDCSFLLYSDGLLVQHDRGGKLVILSADSGEVVWEKTFATEWDSLISGDRVLMGDGSVFVIHRQDAAQPLRLARLELRTGRARWERHPDELRCQEKPVSTFHLVSYAGGTLYASSAPRGAKFERGRCALFALSAADGSLRWTYEFASTGHGGRATNVLVLGDAVWAKTAEGWVAVDPRTGRELRRVAQVEQRCYPDHATPRFLLSGFMDFLDVASGRYLPFQAARSACGSGFFPGNGLVYTLPTRCHCYPMVRGYLGLSPVSGLGDVPEVTAGAGRLERGPGFGESSAGAGRSADPPLSLAPTLPYSESDWPTYRHDCHRSGGTPAAIPADLQPIWERQVGMRVSAPVAAAGCLLVAAPEERRVVAMDAATGALLWSFACGGPVDSPPTLANGRALFGCADGWVYSLDAATGRLAWRFRAAPAERRVVVGEHLESPWPVPGSVLLVDGVAYVATGRHTLLDGGIFLYALDARTGQVLWEKRLTGEQGPELADLLLSDGKCLSLGGRFQFDAGSGRALPSGAGPILWAPHTMLADYSAIATRGGDDNWSGMWLYADKTGIMAFDKFFAHPKWSRRKGTRGNLLVTRGEAVFGVSQDPDEAPQGANSELFRSTLGGSRAWAAAVPPPKALRVTALLLAGNTLVAGASVETVGTGGRGRLLLFDAHNGKAQAQVGLAAAPRWDGLAAAGGRVYIATEAGSILCLGGER